MAQQQYEDEDSGVFMSPDSATKRSTFRDNENEDHEQIAAERRRLFETQQQRDNRMQQALTAARKRMESGRAALEHLMQEEAVRKQKMQSLEAESEKLRSILSQRDMAIAMLTQTVMKERQRFKNELNLLQHKSMAMDTDTQGAETLYVDESLSIVSRKRKRSLPTPPSSDIAGTSLWNKISSP
ncbi:hypothetical protein PG993_002502 [Apiospora rasikravindrae]|uniref:Uncharacterized protein n=1 Tax=Apiospora rasikravindrae TaxID=990691 RepID=A0ABR1TX03_9PEZI